MSNVTPIGKYKHWDINPDTVLEDAKGKLTPVLVLGYEQDGGLYVASSTGDMGQILLLIDKFKYKILNGDLDG